MFSPENYAHYNPNSGMYAHNHPSELLKFKSNTTNKKCGKKQKKALFLQQQHEQQVLTGQKRSHAQMILNSEGTKIPLNIPLSRAV